MYADTSLPGLNVHISSIIVYSSYFYACQLITQTPVITIPYTPNGKCRPNLSSAPQLMPPRQGLRWSGLFNVQSSSTLQFPSSSQQPQSSRSQLNLAATLLPRVRQPVLGVSLDYLSGAGKTVVLAPVRGPGSRDVPAPR